MPQVSQEIIWKPQPGPQTSLITCPIFEVFYGGARGGGKTEGSLGDWLEHSNTYGELSIGVFFRRTFKQLEEVIARSQQIYPKLGAKYNVQKAEWTMPRGGRLKFRYLEKDSDAQEYQGHSYTRVYVEEATNFPSPAPINLLRATLRSAAGVPTGLRLTGNPGGPGHHWVKQRYIDPDPRGWKVLAEEFEGLNGEKLVAERVFIPSKLTDNPLLLLNDPMYVANLHQAGSAALVRAWLQGLWDVVDGAFFDCWEETKHVLPGHLWLGKIPKHSMVFRAMDWGSARPFSVGWYAVSDGTWGLPRDALVKFREWYGNRDGRPNVGLKLDADQVAIGIMAREVFPDGAPNFPAQYGVLDPSAFKRDGGPSIAETMLVKGCTFRRADNSRQSGWAEMRRRLVGKGGVPMLYFLSKYCDDSIRTIPFLQHDELNQEDVDTDGEDHAGDETRYACMARPWTEDEAITSEALVLPRLPSEMTINELVEELTQRRKRAEMDAE